MAKKNYDFFEQFENQMLLCKKSAAQLVDMLEDYTDIHQKAEEIHATEHQADTCLHELMVELNRSFITPIDREDIVQLANELDDITDSIEDVANLFDMLSIEEVKPEAKDLSRLIYDGCEALAALVSEFPRFKNSKNLNELIIKVNKVEESGDVMHRSIIKEMYKSEKNAIELMKWKEIIDTMENVLDNCEDVADLLDGLVIKNS
jgi:predicted phosphate transport protein (TIGR00153 family)